jgi:dTDP-4-dehydrorhamnose reductase
MNSKLSFLIIGASGYMGHHLFEQLVKKYPVFGTFSSNPFPGGIHFDLIKPATQDLPFSKVEYAVIFSAVSKIDFCKSHPELSREINVEGVQNLLIKLKEKKVFPIYISSDSVYPGINGGYGENSEGPAVNVYGEHRREIEKFIHDYFQRYCILRFSKVVGYDDNKSDLLSDLYGKIISGKVLKLVQDQNFQIVSLSDMAAVIERVALKNITGTFNIATPETLSRKELAERLANRLAKKIREIQELPFDYFNFEDKRATNPSMKMDRFMEASGFKFQSVDEILGDFLKEAIEAS